jgi:hypothetical protein
VAEFWNPARQSGAPPGPENGDKLETPRPEAAGDPAVHARHHTEPPRRLSEHALLGVGALAKPTGQEADLVLHGAVVHAVTTLVLPVRGRPPRGRVPRWHSVERKLPLGGMPYKGGNYDGAEADRDARVAGE